MDFFLDMNMPSCSNMSKRLEIKIKIYLHPQWPHLHTAIPLAHGVAILPHGGLELRRPHSNLRQRHTIPGRYVLHDAVNPRIQTEDKAIVLAVEHQITTSQQDFAWSRHGNSGIGHWDEGGGTGRKTEIRGSIRSMTASEGAGHEGLGSDNGIVIM
jgi:hypothetical protein